MQNSKRAQKRQKSIVDCHHQPTHIRENCIQSIPRRAQKCFKETEIANQNNEANKKIRQAVAATTTTTTKRATQFSLSIVIQIKMPPADEIICTALIYENSWNCSCRLTQNNNFGVDAVSWRETDSKKRRNKLTHWECAYSSHVSTIEQKNTKKKLDMPKNGHKTRERKKEPKQILIQFKFGSSGGKKSTESRV